MPRFLRAIDFAICPRAGPMCNAEEAMHLKKNILFFLGGGRIFFIKVLAISDNSDHCSYFVPLKFKNAGPFSSQKYPPQYHEPWVSQKKGEILQFWPLFLA
jgi:hypothetical protein